MYVLMQLSNAETLLDVICCKILQR